METMKVTSPYDGHLIKEIKLNSYEEGFKMLNTATGTISDIQLTSIESITTNDLLDDFYYIENGIHYAKGFVPEDGFPKMLPLKITLILLPI